MKNLFSLKVTGKNRNSENEDIIGEIREAPGREPQEQDSGEPNNEADETEDEISNEEIAGGIIVDDTPNQVPGEIYGSLDSQNGYRSDESYIEDDDPFSLGREESDDTDTDADSLTDLSSGDLSDEEEFRRFMKDI